MKVSINIRVNGQPKPKANDIGATAVKAIQDAMQKEGINATGDTSKSLQATESDYRLTIIASGNIKHAPIRTLQHGSGPHFNSEPKGFVQAIQKWVRVKPGFVPFAKGKDPFTASAWAIIKSIRNKGTQRYRKPRKDIYTPHLDIAIDEFKKKVALVTIEKLLN